MSADNQVLPVKLAELQKKSLFIGAGVTAIALALAAMIKGEYFFQSYLIGFLYAFGFGMGSLVLLCIHHLAGGKWGHCIRRILEAGVQTIPWLFVLFLPIMFFGMDQLYPVWTQVAEELGKGDAKNYAKLAELDPHHLVQMKAGPGQYLTVGGYQIRTVINFAIWAVLGLLFVKWSKNQDEDGDPKWRNKMKALAGPAILIYTLTLTFATVDWVMSITPEWFSSIYGVMFAIGHGLTIFAFSIIFVCWLAKMSPMKEFIGTKQLHDLGKLQFAFVVLWAYIELSQFIIIWSANLGEETPWLLDRATPFFQPISFMVVIGQFAIPFFILLNQRIKQRFDLLPKVCMWLLFVRIVDLYWIVAPSIHTPHFNELAAGQSAFGTYFHISNILAPIGFAALWVALFLHYFRKMPILPLKDPKFPNGDAAGKAHA